MASAQNHAPSALRAGRGNRASGPGFPWTLDRNASAARPPLWARLASLVLGLAIGGLVISATSSADVFSAVWVGTFGTVLGINNLLQLAGPLLIAGCSAAVANRAGLWNIGIEGQLIMGAWAGTGVAYLFPQLSGGLLIPMILLAAVLGGALLMLLPALGRAYFGVNEIVTTLLLNFVATSWLIYWVTGPWRDESAAQSAEIGSRLISTNALAPSLTLGPVTVTFGLLLAIAIAFLLWAVFRYTGFGYRATLVRGDSRSARYAGVDVPRVHLGVLLLSGGIGGLTGIVVELDTIGRLSLSLSNYTGYLGLLVAGLAGASLLECVPMAVLVALITAAGAALQIAGIPIDVVFLLTGTVFLFAALTEVLAQHRVRRRRPPPPELSARAIR